MVGRVLVDTNRIAVSKPGVEVTTASLDQLLLSIDARHGQTLYSDFISGTSGTVSYPTLPALPDAIGQIVWSGSLHSSGAPFISQTLFYSGPQNPFSSDFWLSNTYLQISVGLSSTTFSVSTTFPSLVVGIRYLILRKPLAR